MSISNLFQNFDGIVSQYPVDQVSFIAPAASLSSLDANAVTIADNFNVYCCNVSGLTKTVCIDMTNQVLAVTTGSIGFTINLSSIVGQPNYISDDILSKFAPLVNNNNYNTTVTCMPISENGAGGGANIVYPSILVEYTPLNQPLSGLSFTFAFDVAAPGTANYRPLGAVNKFCFSYI